MEEIDTTDEEAVLEQIRAQAQADNFRLTLHAQQEMVDENISLDETLQALATGQILENYPQHRRGACCLVNGLTLHSRRPLHVVCTTAQPVLIIITVYEPKPPKWMTSTQRGR